MYESNSLMKEAAMLKAAANLLGSLVLGLLAVRGGIWLAGR
jgi:fluoride ion exporter CrcB/FEX